MRFSKKISLAVAVLSLVILNAVSAEENVTNETISNSIQGNERIIMQGIIQNLTEDEQENVIYINEIGDVYANKPELKEEVIEVEKLHDNVFQDKNGEIYVVPKQDPRPTVTSTTYDNTELSIMASYPSCTGGSGPYRRVYSNPSYSWATAYVHLPGGSEINDNNKNASGDTGFVYMGGWGNLGGGVDAGLQHSSTFDNWAPIFQVDGRPLPQTPRFKSNQDIFIKFWVSNDNQVSMYISGNDTNNQKITRTYIIDVRGFSKAGGNILKRMSTIGQKENNENLSSGSYIHNVHWYNSYIGTSSISNHAWTAADQASDSQNGYCSYTPSKVSVQYVNAGEETVNIDL